MASSSRLAALHAALCSMPNGLQDWLQAPAATCTGPCGRSAYLMEGWADIGAARQSKQSLSQCRESAASVEQSGQQKT